MRQALQELFLDFSLSFLPSFLSSLSFCLPHSLCPSLSSTCSFYHLVHIPHHILYPINGYKGSEIKCQVCRCLPSQLTMMTTCDVAPFQGVEGGRGRNSEAQWGKWAEGREREGQIAGATTATDVINVWQCKRGVCVMETEALLPRRPPSPPLSSCPSLCGHCLRGCPASSLCMCVCVFVGASLLKLWSERASTQHPRHLYALLLI